MDIKIIENDKKFIFEIGGRLDSNTAPELEGKVKEIFDKADSLIFDFADLEYISSAGLRVLLASHKKISSANGTMKILNANDSIKDIFNITGMINIFNVE